MVPRTKTPSIEQQRPRPFTSLASKGALMVMLPVTLHLSGAQGQAHQPLNELSDHQSTTPLANAPQRRRAKSPGPRRGRPQWSFSITPSRHSTEVLPSAPAGSSRVAVRRHQRRRSRPSLMSESLALPLEMGPATLETTAATMIAATTVEHPELALPEATRALAVGPLAGEVRLATLRVRAAALGRQRRAALVRAKALRMQAAARARRAARAQWAHALALATHGGIPAKLAWAFACIRRGESGNNYAENTGNGYYGGYQFAPATWAGVGGIGLPSAARPAVQDRLAYRLYQEEGWSPWPQTAPACGL